MNETVDRLVILIGVPFVIIMASLLPIGAWLVVSALAVAAGVWF